MDHVYNDPNISPRDFLLAVARDPRVRLKHRIKAATYLAQIYGDVLVTTQVTIRIGGFPQIIDTWMCADIHDCITHTDPCPWEEIIRSIQGVRFRPCKDQVGSQELPNLVKNSRLN
jgi:hypothetical protein